MAPSGGPSTSRGGGAAPLGTLTEDEVASWTHTRLLQALYEYELLDPAVADADTASLRARLLANLRTQAAAFTALGQQPPSDDAAPAAQRDVGLPPLGTPRVQAGTSHEGPVSPATPRTEQHPVADGGDAGLATVPFGYGPYARPKHRVDPSDGRNLEAAFAAVEDSPPREDLFAALDQDDTRRENAAAGHARDDWAALPPSTMAVGGPGDDPDARSEVSMGVPDDELHRPRVPKRTMADRSPPQSGDYRGGSVAIECDSPPAANFPPHPIDAALEWPALGADLPPHGAASTGALAGAPDGTAMGALPLRDRDRSPSPRATTGTQPLPAQGAAP